MNTRPATLAWLVVLALLPGTRAAAQSTPAPADAAQEEKKPPKRWKTTNDLSFVATEGNSTTQTLGFKDTTEYKTTHGLSRLRVDTLVSDTSDDAYYLLEPGFVFVPGEAPSGYTTTAVRPGAEPDVARYFVEGRYEGNFHATTATQDPPTKQRATWNAGASWDRNEDAGVLNRYIVFSGLGHVWRDGDDFKFRTSYGLSYTDREEEIDDPERDRKFAGARLTAYFKDRWAKSTTYDLDGTFNANLSDLGDYNLDLTQSVAVSMTEHLSIRVSLQWLYASEPALEEVDVIARVLVVDPDGVPGSGDEFYETTESGGTEIVLGEDVLRKKELDTTLRTSLSIEF